jgi:hypothetical protein
MWAQSSMFINSHRYAYEVECLTLAGQSVGVVTLGSHQVRAVATREITHARALAAPQYARIYES